MDWKRIFQNAMNTAPNPERVDELSHRYAEIAEEWAMYSLSEYFARSYFSKEELDTLLAYCLECDKFYEENKHRRLHHFGYPANLLDRSPLYDLFAEQERRGYLANNCGDTFEQANYSMDSKAVEISILNMFAKRFKINHLPFWGYITSGGSESNSWGIENGFRTFPDGILYFCESAHYSVMKFATGKRYIRVPQISPTNEAICVDTLLNVIRANPEPIILFLTWGTTRFGSCDDILRVTSFLKDNGRNYYLHVDAALYGGIPENQKDAPILDDMSGMGIDSLSVSLHKYFGIPLVKSVVLATKKPDAQVVSYIGITDSTTSGSRDILPFSMRQQIFDVLNFTPENEYVKNISIFQSLLEEYKIPYIRADKGNIFVIDKPSDDICKKYQLSSFDITDANGKKISKAHIIIFPYQNKTVLRELAQDLSGEAARR